MRDIALSITCCGFIAGSVYTTGLPEFLFTFFAILAAASISKVQVIKQ